MGLHQLVILLETWQGAGKDNMCGRIYNLIHLSNLNLRVSVCQDSTSVSLMCEPDQADGSCR